MGLVTFKDLVIDVEDPAAAAGRWGRWLHLDGEIDDEGAVLRGDDPGQTIWLNPAPRKQVKNRVHLDLVARDLEPFADQIRLTEPGEFSWTSFSDPEGHEFCVFEGGERPDGLKDVVIDSVDHRAIGAWWADVFGATLGSDDEYSWVDDIPGSPTESFDFVDVPEPKTVKNRVHWDVALAGEATVDDLVARGATVLLPPGDDRGWTVMADPEGNEFCVFDA
ncbi:VOC family protein [Aeromicrobium duanguangcaii]|uniref:VOC family protein n=1 Tax=Aeromicrobium duanguangcaii TaxID=2968086 RepID=A0ABY5KCY6_9ACTN|nr:VOC family protein [Aeromicrobium duanguangcaii]MCD9154698.1 VOC family protein [Aeromicrobium duanguangcaii]UUI67888.1 VOC family protein [Aeromicrobium duanguangcaii]